jgi:hypothetical protein
MKHLLKELRTMHVIVVMLMNIVAAKLRYAVTTV